MIFVLSFRFKSLSNFFNFCFYISVGNDNMSLIFGDLGIREDYINMIVVFIVIVRLG